MMAFLKWDERELYEKVIMAALGIAIAFGERTASV